MENISIIHCPTPTLTKSSFASLTLRNYGVGDIMSCHLLAPKNHSRSQTHSWDRILEWCHVWRRMVGQGRTQGHLALAQITYVAPLCRKSWPLPSSDVAAPPFDTRTKPVATRPTQTPTPTPKWHTPTSIPTPKSFHHLYNKQHNPNLHLNASTNSVYTIPAATQSQLHYPNTQTSLQIPSPKYDQKITSRQANKVNFVLLLV